MKGVVTVVVLGAVVLGVGLVGGLGALAALTLSVRAAEVGRQTSGLDGVPLVGGRHAQFGDATAVARTSRPASAPGSSACSWGTSPEQRPLRLVPPSSGAASQPHHPLRAA